MIFNESTKKAINHCLENGIAFVAYRIPNKEVVFFADNGSATDSKRKFIINLWDSPASENTIIGDCLDADSVINICSKSNAKKLPTATSKHDYILKVGELIKTLNVRGGKTVISRVYAGNLLNCNWAEKAEILFNRFPNAFCHIYYTPKTGAWMGATPEVLLDVNNQGVFKTMSLAGTHPIGEEWDDKNRQEQKMVTDFISDKLHPLCSTVKIFPTESLQYGHIEHLCSRFEGNLKTDVSPIQAMTVLSPTPAVAGFPRENAINEINRIEEHHRECYSGYIAVDDGSDMKAYVNLRCMQFNSDGSYCLYAGGGITAESVPENEWEETNSKLSSLIAVLNS